ncbi:MAG: NAD(P)H-hydrate dehydratase, partial [Acidobacteriota bacterium]|nr:NAD(P)H-hydrate dehydratase [Acidobacteriota bacterium]
PGPVLMENAGLRIVDEIVKRFPEPARERIVVVAGKGNNGGDGLVVARHLRQRGGKPVVLLLAAKDDLKGDAALNLAAAEKSGVEVVDASTELCWKKQKTILAHASIIVDAIFGTGLDKPAAGVYAVAIDDINKARGFKVAVDIPSGLSSDSFSLIGPSVKADLTVALAAPKIGHIFAPASERVGELVVADIGIPKYLMEAPELKLSLTGPEDVRPLFAPRRRDGHKGTYGHLLVIAGSVGKTGAAVLAGKAALRMGAGLVTIATAERAVPTVARAMAELMTEPLPETPAGTVSLEALSALERILKGKNGVVLGPGLSTDPSTALLVLAFLPRLKVPVVIDADGLNILAEHLDILKKLTQPVVLTPHPGEFARLTGRTVAGVLDKRLELAPAFAREHNVILVLKGHHTLIAAPDGRVFINPTGNPGMATGGSGDVLSGMIGSLMVQSKDIPAAVRAAVYAHGLSGDLAAAKLGERSLIAGDIIRFLPAAVKSLEDAAK